MWAQEFTKGQSAIPACRSMCSSPAAMVNIILDLCCLSVAFQWGVFGVALAAVLPVVSAVLIMVVRLMRPKITVMELKKSKFDPASCLRDRAYPDPACLPGCSRSCMPVSGW